jgi:hypothetical protein
MLEAVIGGSSASGCTLLRKACGACTVSRFRVDRAESFQLYPSFFLLQVGVTCTAVPRISGKVSFDRQPPRSRVQYNRVIELMLCGVSAACTLRTS